MAFYQVSDIDPKSMADDAIRNEVADLRSEITSIQVKLSERKSWADAEHRVEEDEHKLWLARTRRYHGMLQARLARLKPLLRQANIREAAARGTNDLRKDDVDARDFITREEHEADIAALQGQIDEIRSRKLKK